MTTVLHGALKLNRIDEEEPLKKSVSGQPRLRYIEILIAKNNSLVCKYNVVKCCALHFRFILNYQDAKMFRNHEVVIAKESSSYDFAFSKKCIVDNLIHTHIHDVDIGR